MRKFIFGNDNIYHIFNRGIEKRPTFTDKKEYLRAILTLDYYRYKNPSLRLAKFLQLEKDKRQDFLSKLKKESKKLTGIISYCLMPNHFHLLVRQNEIGGISKFLSNLTNSYTRYFNTKHRRKGPLFEGNFKAIRIEDDEQLLHVSRYIHINPVVAYIIKEQDLNNYSWSSLPEFLGVNDSGVCDKEIILSHFSSKEKYLQFIHDQVDYAKKIDLIKHLLIE